jgi:hypothetical protein
MLEGCDLLASNRLNVSRVAQDGVIVNALAYELPDLSGVIDQDHRLPTRWIGCA